MLEIARRRGLAILALALASILTSGPGRARAEDPKVADSFGFLPLEVYKLESRIGGLLIKDLDGDKVEDVGVINNARSRIDLLLSGKKAGGGEDDRPAQKEVNDLVGDRRMRLVSLPVNKAVASLQAGDFDGDGKADIVFYGEPAGLEIHFNKGNGRFGDVKRINVGDAIDASGGLSVGDFDRDGRDDLALLTAEEIVLIYQRQKGKLSDPERLPHALSKPRMVKAVDMDGDSVDDLVMLNGEPDDPIRIRFAAEKGAFGPEERFSVEALRAYAFGPMDRKPGSEFLTVENQSGRARVFTLDEGDDEDSARGRLSFYPLPPAGNGPDRSLDVGDLDGDGKVEVVATDPSRARFLTYRRSGQFGLGAATADPGLAGGGPIRLADVDGDGKAEVYVLSEKEKQIGRSVAADGRLSFPTPLPTTGDPVALEVADLDGDKAPEVIYVTRDRSGGSTADLFTLRALAREKSGGFARFLWGKLDGIPLKEIGGVPPRLVVTDLDGDARPDIVVFDAYGPPSILLGKANGEAPTPPAGGLGPLAEVGSAALTLADLDGPAILAAGQSFARKLALDKDGHWVVREQFDPGRPGGQVQGVAALDTDGDGVKEIALLERTSKSLLFLARKDGAYRPAGRLSVGAFDDFREMHVADLDGDGKDDLILAGTTRFGVVLTGRKGRKLKVIASYESPRNEARFADLAAGDLNADGQPDVVLTDVAEHFLEIATAPPGQAELDRAAAFKVFERKTRRNLTDIIEPRDIALGDVDGDGRLDIVLIVHDRVLIYRQDPGPSPEKDKDKDAIKAADQN